MKIKRSDLLTGLYSLNQTLLNTAVGVYSSATRLPATVAAAVADIGHRLDRDEQCSPDVIAKHTAELFSCLAGLGGSAHVDDLIRRINGRLHDVRTFESQRLVNVDVELMTMCERFLAESYDALAEAITNYHDRRLALMNDLYSRTAQ